MAEDSNMSKDWIERAWAKNPCVKLGNGDVRTGPVRLSFPHLFEPGKPVGDNTEGKHGVSLLFPLGADITTLRKDAADAARGKWADKLPRGLKSPFLEQGKDADRYAGYVEGAFLIRATSQRKIIPVDRNLAPIIDEDKVYAGVWAIVTLRAFTYDLSASKGVSFGLQNVMIVADDTDISGVAPAKPQDAFAGVSIEAGDIDADKAFGEGEKAQTADVDIFS